MNRRKFMLLAAGWPAVMQTALMAREPSPKEYLDQLVKDGVAPGAALIVSRRGSVNTKKAVGTFCEIGDRTAKLTMDTIHPLYSFSKLVTGTMVAIAKTEGLLDYKDLVSKHVPEFAGGGKETITIRHCLTHSAGLTKVEAKGVHDPEGWKTALGNLCSAKVEWEPGSRSAYHGWSGAFLAAECVRRVYGGKPWAELCRTMLFEIIGTPSLSYNLPASHTHVAIIPQPPIDKTLPATPEVAFGYAGQPGAGCFGTLGDALKLLHLHLQQGIWKSRRLIAPDVFREMHTVQFSSEIAAARSAGQVPKYEPWGLGPLLRGEGPACEAHKWFGFANQSSPSIFGHAGINTLIGVGDLKRQMAFLFLTTNSPKSAEATVLVRNRITDLVFQ